MPSLRATATTAFFFARLPHFQPGAGPIARTGFLEESTYQALEADLRPQLVVGYFVPCRLGELRDLEWHQVELWPAPGEIVFAPGTTKNKLGRSMGMIGEMREALHMQKTIGDEKFPDCPYVFFNERGEQIGDFRKAWASACKRCGAAIGREEPETTVSRSKAQRSAESATGAIDRSVIKRIGGWKTEAMFIRYNIVGERDLWKRPENGGLPRAGAQRERD
jgi:hypothetical protein